MKWGKHIFGKDPKKEYTDDSAKAELRNYRKSTSEVTKPKGIHLGDTSDTIEKGTKFYRVTDKAEEDHNKRIYADASWDAHMDYISSAIEGMMWTDGHLQESMYSHALTTTKSLQVAKGKDVVDYITNTYATDEQKKAVKFLRDIDYNNLDTFEVYKANPELDSYLTKRYADGINFITKVMMDPVKSGRVYDEFKKRGYDAIVDPEDGTIRNSNYPVILLNPSKTVKTDRVWDIYNDKTLRRV